MRDLQTKEIAKAWISVISWLFFVENSSRNASAEDNGSHFTFHSRLVD